ncbi:MAG: hypothetical protein HDR30_08535 [Lachnospiraceae bacterium]|nr:hypothetical protein [Lachnospiraceae bacterium]
MERDFELEYRELKQNETPDLWNRIEAGLSEKKIAAVPLENESKSIDIERYVVKKQTPWKRWGLLAAACLCVVIILPAMMIGLTGSSKSHSSRADTASGAADMNTSSSAAASSEPAEAFAPAPAEAAEEGKETAALEDAETSEEAETEAVMPELTDGQILTGAVVQILQADETGEETVYQAVVLEADTDAVLESGMQIELICNDETQYDFVRGPREEKGLKKEETYEVSLQYEQDRFVVLKAAKKN